MQKKFEPVAHMLRRLVKTVKSARCSEPFRRFARERMRWSLKGNSALRSAIVKQGAALVLMVLVTVASVETVMAATHVATVNYNGTTSRVEMTSAETDQILRKAGLKTSPDDLVVRSEDPDHAGDAVITVKTAQQVTVEADGTKKTVTAYYGDTVADVLEKAGVTLGADDLVTPAENVLAADGMNVRVTRRLRVTVAADGNKVSAVVRAGSVSDAVRQAGIQLGSADTLNLKPDAKVSGGMTISVSRVTYQNVTQTRAVPYQKTVRRDSSLAAGKKVVQTAGQNGSQTVVVRQKLIDGKVAESQDVSSAVTAQPVSEVTLIGTKKSAGTVAQVNSDGTLTDQNGNTVHYKRVLAGRCSCYTGGGWTSTGRPAAFGLVAVNPSLIPYGTRMYICSPDGKLVYGYAVAADTGGAAMRGAIIADLYYDSYNQCMKIGTRTMNVYIL